MEKFVIKEKFNGEKRLNMKHTNAKNKLYVVMYHYVRDLSHSRYPQIKGLDLLLFREQIKYLKEVFHVITMEEVIAAVDRKSTRLNSSHAL